MEELDGIIERIVTDLTQKTAIRDLTLQRSRALIRFCANSIRATHRHEFDKAQAILGQAKEAAAQACEDASAYADVFYAGYLQDALKELAEAAITLAITQQAPLPDPDDLGIAYPAWLNGLGEAMGEMRRFALDCIRRNDIQEAERLLGVMDEVYSYLVTIDFSDSMTGHLRRTTDMVRGVTERTRGDLTTAARQERLQSALRSLEAKLLDSQ